MLSTDQIFRHYSILIVDHDGENLEAFRLNFRNKFNIISAGSGAEALKELADPDKDVAVIVTDQRLPGMTGIELLAKVEEKKPGAVGIIMSTFADPSMLVSALNRGLAYRFIGKPWKADDMEVVLVEAIKRYHDKLVEVRRIEQIKSVNNYLKSEIKESCDYERIVGADGGLREVMEQVRRVAGGAGNVLLRGEPGVGKELIARALHHLSSRADRAMIKLDVASFNPKGLDSEFFGAEKTVDGASSIRLGRLELAHGSALFINDIADLPIETQVKLTRVLNEKNFERLGGNEPVQVDVRVIAVTQRNLEELIARRHFRGELFNALNSFTIPIPPLREREEDIPALTQHFVDKYSKKLGKGKLELDPGVMERLEAYYWPGNVLELENVIQRAVILSKEGRIRTDNLEFVAYASERPAPKPVAARQSKADNSGSLTDKLEEMERIELIDALKKAGGHKANAARMLGINRSTMYYRLKKHGILPK